MRIAELTGKLFLLVYRVGKWTLGIVAALIFTVLVFSLGRQELLKRSIERGMTRAEVVAELGKPRLELEELGFCSNGSWLGDCEAARQSGAVRYLVWKYGIDTYFVVGLDKDARVVFHDMGDA